MYAYTAPASDAIDLTLRFLWYLLTLTFDCMIFKTCHCVVLMKFAQLSSAFPDIRWKSNLVHSADLCRGRVRVRVRAVIDRYDM